MSERAERIIANEHPAPTAIDAAEARLNGHAGGMQESGIEAPPPHHDYAPAVLDMRPVKVGLGGPTMQMRQDRARLRVASWAFTTRRVPQGVAASLRPPEGRPQVGDLILARVDAIGHHPCLQLANGRRRHLFVGDEMVVAYGHRYASNQFESLVPETLGPCHLVAGGGVASRAISWHANVKKGPTHITPIGLLADEEGRRVNLREYALPSLRPMSDQQPATIAVIGTSMDSGKTQTAVYVTRGLVAAGLRVGYAKVTGTGAGGDIWWLRDAGADPVLDFTDAGVPSTYLMEHTEIENLLSLLVAHVDRHGVDAIVLELADGVLQRETAELLRSPVFARLVGGVVLAAQDAMGASAGIDFMSREKTPVLALSGVLTAAPLQVAEARAACGSLPVHDREGLAKPEIALELLGRAQHNQDLGRREADAGAA
ncbi:MAG: DUF1611 domain-containing protein [Woeseiaceae bacterium]